jgi:hypothetical protein
MKNAMILVLLLSAAFLLESCATPPKVVQGIVVSYDKATETMVIQDESKPGSTLTFSLENAEIGAEAFPGDTVRISFLDQDSKLAATRVMNITRQEELGKKAAK